tara:strand:- start:615 stop:1022 length:408 start_codon:yes stop_codon:yes gene_type:complete
MDENYFGEDPAKESMPLLPTTSIPKEKSKEKRHSKMKLRSLDSDTENNDEKTPKYNFTDEYKKLMQSLTNQSAKNRPSSQETTSGLVSCGESSCGLTVTFTCEDWGNSKDMKIKGNCDQCSHQFETTTRIYPKRD